MGRSLSRVLKHFIREKMTYSGCLNIYHPSYQVSGRLKIDEMPQIIDAVSLPETDSESP